MTPALVKHHFDYVLGPNQDPRLASVVAGTFANPTTITGIVLEMDTDAPFVLTSRAVRARDVQDVGQVFGDLATQWSGPNRDFRCSSGGGARIPYVQENLQMVNYGQFGNPKPIVPGIVYPAGAVLILNLRYAGVGSLCTTLTNLTFYFRGYKLYPKDTVNDYTYPTRFATQTFAYPVQVTSLGVSETRQGNIFTVKQDADFVLRAGQWIGPDNSVNGVATRQLKEVSIILRDANKLPYSNDFVPLSVLFGSASIYNFVDANGGNALATPYGTGPGSPGLLYPEIYLPKNHQLIYDLQRSDGAIRGNVSETFTFNLIGAKVFNK